MLRNQVQINRSQPLFTDSRTPHLSTSMPRLHTPSGISTPSHKPLHRRKPPQHTPITTYHSPHPPPTNESERAIYTIKYNQNPAPMFTATRKTRHSTAIYPAALYIPRSRLYPQERGCPTIDPATQETTTYLVSQNAQLRYIPRAVAPLRSMISTLPHPARKHARTHPADADPDGDRMFHKANA